MNLKYNVVLVTVRSCTLTLLFLIIRLPPKFLPVSLGAALLCSSKAGSDSWLVTSYSNRKLCGESTYRDYLLSHVEADKMALS